MKRLSCLALMLLSCLTAMAQEEAEGKKEPPAFSLLRANEDYGYLKDKEASPYEATWFDPIKFIPLSPNKGAYLSVGGQLRPRVEYYANRFWEGEEDVAFYSQRLALHANLVLGPHVRVFGELYHGYVSGEQEFAEYDPANVHQAFIDVKLPAPPEATLLLRAGRQEMPFGAARLVGLREGPNIRRTFDATRLIYSKGLTRVQAFYAREVRPALGAFDNEFTLLNSAAANPTLWG